MAFNPSPWTACHHQRNQSNIVRLGRVVYTVMAIDLMAAAITATYSAKRSVGKSVRIRVAKLGLWHSINLIHSTFINNNLSLSQFKQFRWGIGRKQHGTFKSWEKRWRLDTVQRLLTILKLLFSDRRQINPILDRAAPLRDSRIERRNSGSKSLRSGITNQDSLEDVPDIHSGNQDVSA